MLYGLLLDDRDAGLRKRQRDLVAARAGADALRTLDELAATLGPLGEGTGNSSAILDTRELAMAN